MEAMKGKSLLLRLKKMNWRIISRTYGNCHSTLIGLLVDWWISMSPKHWSLEGGPTNGYKEKGVRGQCDALLGFKEKAVGILEVEGTRHKIAVSKIGTFLMLNVKNTTIFILQSYYFTLMKHMEMVLIENIMFQMSLKQ